MRSVRLAILALLALGALLLPSPAQASPGTTERASVSSDGSEGNADSHRPAISGDGRFVAFESYASNLVPGDTNGTQDVFVHDSQTGATIRVSVDSAGSQGNEWSSLPKISGDGRFVAFGSLASNLISGDTNGVADTFVNDRDADGDGIFDEPGEIVLVRVSLDSAGNEGNSASGSPAITPDGRFIAFGSSASNLVPADTNGLNDIFVRDRQTGTTELVSMDSAGNQANDESQAPAISADGRFITFWSLASNLVPGDTNGAVDVFVRDRQTGATVRVSVDSAGNEASCPPNYICSYDPALNADGRFVAFWSLASNLVAGDTNDTYDVFIRDRDTDADGVFDEPGAVVTTRASVSSAGGQGTGESRHPTLSSDGRFVAFWSLAPNLVAGDTNGTYDIFVHDRDTDSDGIFDEPGEVATTLVSTSSGGRQGNHSSDDSAISADGRFLAFWSLATNLVPGDTNDTWDVFVHDRLAAPQGPFCAGFLATIVGTGGDDLLTGTAGVDVIKGLGGDDTIDGLEGADVICADRGNDTVAGGPGVDLILGGPGNDQLFGQDDIDLIWGNAGDDAMDGGSDLDACNGGPNVAGDTALNCEFTFGVP